MADTALESLLKRDRSILLVSLAALTALAWGYVLWLAAHPMSGMVDIPAADSMAGMDMPGMTMPATPISPSLKSWAPADFAFTFAMWAVMMVGMMTPSVAPMVLLYARVGRQAAQSGQPLAATSWFALGYLLAWAGFALFATLTQWILEQALILTPMMQLESELIGGLVLIVIGLYQFTPLKYSCLAQCQAPLSFIQRQGGFKREPLQSLKLGATHGLYCIGCCWALMALLFVGGIMNVMWIAAISILVLAEKLVPAGRMVSRVLGVAIALVGVYFIVQYLR